MSHGLVVKTKLYISEFHANISFVLIYHSLFQAPNPLTPQMLCAGVENTILSSCYGDIGGPYACLNSDMKTYTLHGIVSWGPGSCNASEYYTVFTRVTKFRAWIKQHTGIAGRGGGLEHVTYL